MKNIFLLTEDTFLLFHIKEYRQKCRDLEYEKITAQKQIESLESQKKSLNEKYELVQVNLNVFSRPALTSGATYLVR